RSKFRSPPGDRVAAIGLEAAWDRHGRLALRKKADRAERLEQTEIAQFATQRLGQIRNPRPRRADILRRVAGLEIAPALERAHRTRHHPDHLRLHDEPATPDAVLVAKRLDRDDLLTRRDLAADHPVKRTAFQYLVDALGRHAGDMDVMARQTLALGGSHAFGDPALEFLEGLATDGKLDEMKRHSSCVSSGFLGALHGGGGDASLRR